jgi:hypothetical protein
MKIDLFCEANATQVIRERMETMPNPIKIIFIKIVFTVFVTNKWACGVPVSSLRYFQGYADAR